MIPKLPWTLGVLEIALFLKSLLPEGPCRQEIHGKRILFLPHQWSLAPLKPGPPNQFLTWESQGCLFICPSTYE